VRKPETIADDFHEAFRLVRLQMGPVVLRMPTLDSLIATMVETTEYEPASQFLQGAEGIDPSLPGIEAVAGMLLGARRPIILAGRGALDAHDEIVKLADRCGALLATSLQARELFRGHPRNIGILGTYANESVSDLLPECDVFLALGASLNPYQTGGGAIAPNARTIQVDIDPSRLGAITAINLGIAGDVGTVVAAINGALNIANIDPAEGGWENDRLSPLVKAASVFPSPAEPAPSASNASARMSASSFLRGLDELLPSNRHVVVDGGFFMNFVIDQITIPDPSSWIWSLEFASIGLGLSLGIGAAVGREDKRCIVFVGDGGLAMSLQEFDTIVRERIPLVVVVMNDGTYMSEVAALEDANFPTQMAEMGKIDFSSIAKAFGAVATTVHSLADLATVSELLQNLDGPIVIDAMVDEHEDHRKRRAG
jgi:thiamine pyrophosphate-dependent acetolactate synthase large subunit-like protein